ncbi:MAG: hypothetical protein LBG14_01880 [Treponema sp.]|jgi:hypothetical protein|nr:hypothetical protein [Treponema sp.]
MKKIVLVFLACSALQGALAQESSGSEQAAGQGPQLIGFTLGLGVTAWFR